jgi:hypothetical protein
MYVVVDNNLTNINFRNISKRKYIMELLWSNWSNIFYRKQDVKIKSILE